MNGKQLKNSILQWAIQGKLVPQDPNDEPASVLLERIREEKIRLVKEKKIKKDKNESIIFRGDDNSHYEKFADGTVKCIDDEIPFEIPQSWCWVRGKHIFLPMQSIKPIGEYFTYIDIDAVNNKVNIIDKAKNILCSQAPSRASRKLEANSILFSMVRPYLRNITMVGEEYKDAIASTGFYVVTPSMLLFTKYIFNLLLSSYVVDGLNQFMKGDNSPSINNEHIEGFLYPVPPVNEQQKIVAEIEKIMPFADKYEESQEALNKLNVEIFDKLKKSVLQEAIQGKLIPQSPDDEPASVLLERIKEEKAKLFKDGKLKKKDLVDSVIFKGDDNKYYEKIGSQVTCIDDDIPFEIPTSWAWVRLEQLCTYIQRGKSPKYSEIRKYPVVAQKCNQWTGFSLEKALFLDPATIDSYGEERFLQDGDLLWNSTGLGTLGRMAIYDSSKNEYGLAVADSHVTVIRAIPSMVSSEYLFKYFSSHTVQSVIEDKSEGSTKQKELATSTVKSYMVPLPPYEEQVRIVERYEFVIASIMRR